MRSYIALLMASSMTALAGSAAAAQTAPAAATADNGSDNALTEIVVTGSRKRNEAVQAVPLAITAVSAAALDRRNISSMADLSEIAPTFHMHHAVATVSQSAIFLRGFGTDTNDPSVDPPIAVVVDGIYQPTFSNNLVDLFDVETVEVDRGPQGTLLGKNAPTGALVITSRRPTGHFDGAAEVSYERFDRFQAKARVDLPLVTDILAANVSASYSKGGNFVKDLFTGKTQFGGEDAKSVRVGLLFTPSSAFKWYVSARGEWRRDPQGGIRDISYLGASGPLQLGAVECLAFGHCAPTKPDTNTANLTGKTSANIYYVSSEMTYDIDPITFTSVTGYIHDKHSNTSDSDGVMEDIIGSPRNPARYSQISEEFRAASNKGGGLDLDGRLDWVLGAYYSRFKYEDTEVFDILGSLLGNNQRGISRSTAIFAHAIYNLTPKWSFSIGGRQTWDRKTHNYIATGETVRFFDIPGKWKNFSVEAGTQYKLSDHQQAYFRFAQGYRGGGLQGLPSPGGTGSSYDPERVNTFELGMKADFLDEHLRINGDVYQSNYKGLQRTVLQPINVAPFYLSEIKNAASARTRGVELEVTAVPVNELTLNATVGYIDAKYKKFIAALIPGPATDNSNFPFPYTSKWTVGLNGTYVVALGNAGNTSFNLGWDYRSHYSAANLPYPAANVAGFGLLNASVKWEDKSGRYSLTLYGENLTNHKWFTSILTVPGQLAPFFITLDSKPTVYGIRLAAKF